MNTPTNTKLLFLYSAVKAKRVYVGGQGEGHFCWGPLRAGSLEAEPEGGGVACARLSLRECLQEKPVRVRAGGESGPLGVSREL